MAANRPGSDQLIHANKRIWAVRAPEILAALLLIHSAMFSYQYATRTPMIDFFIFWSVPHSLSSKPATNIYTEEGRREMGAAMAAEAQAPSTSETQRQATAANQQDELHQGKVDSHGSPFLYALIGLMSSGDYAADQNRFALISGLCLAASVALICYLLRVSLVTTLLALAFLAADFAPVVTDLGVGNLNEIQLFGIASFIFLAGRSRHLAAGVAVGLTSMLKPTTAIVIVLAVIVGLADKDFRRLIRLLIGVCVAAAAAIALSSLYFANPKMWIGFIGSLSGTLGDGSYPLENGNYGLAKLLFGGTGPGPTLILIILLAAFSWVVFSSRRKTPVIEPSVPNAFAAAGVGCAIMLLSSPLAWVHYYVLLIPLSLYVMRPVPDTEEASPWIDGLLPKLLAFVPLLMLSDLAQFAMGSSPRTLATDFNCAVILTLALAMLHIRRQRLSSGDILAAPAPKSPKPGRTKAPGHSPA